MQVMQEHLLVSPKGRRRSHTKTLRLRASTHILNLVLKQQVLRSRQFAIRTIRAQHHSIPGITIYHGRFDIRLQAEESELRFPALGLGSSLERSDL